jgi:transcriptional regulator with XRE-family HTH domain
MNTQESVGELIRERRKALGYSLQELSDLSGMKLQYLSLVERGEVNVTVKTLDTIALALGRKLKITFGKL